MLVRRRSSESFLVFTAHDACLAGMGQRTVAVENCRLRFHFPFT